MIFTPNALFRCFSIEPKGPGKLGRAALFLALATALWAEPAVYGASLTEVHGFPNGVSPNRGLIQWTNGNFYGVTQQGGANGLGSIFQISPAGEFAEIVSFNRANGANPCGRLLSAQGFLWGTTSSGGAKGKGTVFRLSSAGTLATVVSFNGTNGAVPMAGLVRSGGNFIGVTAKGGSNDCGVVFTLSNGALTNVLSFDSSIGSSPERELVAGADGLYGVAPFGGPSGLGSIFRIRLATGELTNLVSFDGAMGSHPKGLAMGPNGQLFGTTLDGGAFGFGTVFEVTSQGALTTLAAFNRANGASPGCGLVLAKDGCFYGTTGDGGQNNLGTVFKMTTAGQMTTLASFDWASGAYPCSELVEAGGGTFYGATLGGGSLGGGNIFRLGDLPPFIVKQPVSLTRVTGTMAIFGVAASGSLPLAFRWQKDGFDLDDGANIFGAATSSLTLGCVTDADEGLYGVTIGGKSQSIVSANVSLIVTPDRARPAVAIISPRPGARAAVATCSGIISDNARVARVTYWVTNVNNSVVTTSEPAEASLTGTNWSRMPWEGTPNWLPGTNIIAVQGFDFSSNASVVVTRSFFFQKPTPFTLTLGGDGTIKAGAVPAREPVPVVGTTNLFIGQRYTLKAIPGPNSFFSNWVTSVGIETNQTLRFIMEEGFTVQANFVTNRFVGLAGKYDGLFASSAGVALESAGALSGLSIDTVGRYSGRLLWAGQVKAFSGAFDLSGHARNVLPGNGKGLAGVIVDMAMDWSAGNITGTVSSTNSLWTADFVAQKTGKESGINRYTMVIPPDESTVPASPGGYGYALITDRAGMATISGKLADGAPFSLTTPVSASTNLPVYASLYRGNGLIWGRIDLSSGAPVGQLTWVKKKSASGLYQNGFTNVTPVLGSSWKAPARRTPAIALSQGQIDISGGNLGAALSFNVQLNSNNSLAQLPGGIGASFVGGTIDPASGLLKVSFNNGKGTPTTLGWGAVLQDQASGFGFFLGGNASGSIRLAPKPD